MERLTALGPRIYSPEAGLAYWTRAISTAANVPVLGHLRYPPYASATLTAGMSTCVRV